MVAGVCTGVGFSNLKISGPKPRSGFKNFVIGVELESEKVTLATSAGYTTGRAVQCKDG